MVLVFVDVRSGPIGMQHFLSYKIYHATLSVDDFAITGGDLPSNKYAQPNGFSIVLGMDNPVTPSGSSTNFHGTAESRCGCTRLFGQAGTVQWSISSESPGK